MLGGPGQTCCLSAIYLSAYRSFEKEKNVGVKMVKKTTQQPPGPLRVAGTARGFPVQKGSKKRQPSGVRHRVPGYIRGSARPRAFDRSALRAATLLRKSVGQKMTLVSKIPSLPQTWQLTGGPFKRKQFFQVPSHKCYVSGRKGRWSWTINLW